MILSNYIGEYRFFMFLVFRLVLQKDKACGRIFRQIVNARRHEFD